jgi:V/A-type H+-transporting ATPase subunit I
MQKVRIVSLESDKQAVIAALHAIGAIDLRKSKLEISDDRPAPYSTDVSDALIKVTSALQLLVKGEVRSEKHVPVENLVAQVKGMGVLNRIYGLGEERKSLQEDQKALEYAVHIASSFPDVKIDFGRLRSDYLAYRAFETDSKGAKIFARRAEGSGYQLEVNMSRAQKGAFLVLVAYDRSKGIEELYKGIKANELDLGAKYIDGRASDILKKARIKRAENARRLAEIADEIKRISARNYSRLANIKEMLEIELDRAEASSMFKRTDRTFVVEGWVQKKDIRTLEDRLGALTDSRVHFEELEGDELAPTQTNRPGFLKPFDYLVGFYSVQRSDEIDPTWIFILSFPIFYGLMVTDVGYGLVSLLLASFITKKTNPDGLMYNAARLWQLNSVAAIAFGLLSNQWFGFQLNSYLGLPQVFDWLKNTPMLIAITVIFGIIQVVLGLALGIINSYHHGHKKLAVARFTSILVVIFGTIAVAGFFFSAFGAQTSNISAGIAAVSALLTLVLSGSEATEIVNLVTHPLSYARLMGFGLGSVIIAFLIDMAFTPNLNGGIIVFVVYAIIFILLHLINMVLAIFEGLVQGVRLNFVEFFSKFYFGNGIPFKPFSYKRVYTKE